MLQYLYIGNMNVDIRIEVVQMLLKGLRSLETLGLFNVNLGKIPADLLWRLPKLKVGFV